MNELVMRAYRTGLLQPVSLTAGEFFLKDTEFFVTIGKNKTQWKKKFVPRVKRSGGSGIITRSSYEDMSKPLNSGIHYENTTFESIFESCPKSVQEELIYHLDIFQR